VFAVFAVFAVFSVFSVFADISSFFFLLFLSILVHQKYTAEFETIVRQLGFHWPQRDVDALCELFDGPEGDGKVELVHIIRYGKNHWESFILSLTVITFALYPTIVRSVFRLLACRQNLEDGTHDMYLQSDLSLPCYDGIHWVMLMFIGMPSFFIYVLGFPLGTYVVLYKNRNNWMDDTVMYKYGMLMAGYRHEIFFWEIVITARKACMIAISVFLATFGAEIQVFVGIFVLVFFLGLHLHYNPYEIDNLNRLETAALASEFLTLYSGLLYYWQQFEDDNTGRMGLTIFLIFVQAAFALGTMEVLFDQYVRRMGPETFVGACLHCKRRKKKQVFASNREKTKVSPINKVVAKDIGKHLGKMAARNGGKPLRGIKLLKNAARVMTGSFTRVDEKVKLKYEANRRKLKVHFKSTVSNLKMHKSLNIKNAKETNLLITTAMSVEVVSPEAIRNLQQIISNIEQLVEKGEHLNRSTIDTCKLGKSKIYSMKVELINSLKTITKNASNAKTADIKEAMVKIEKAMTDVAEAGIENQDELIEESLNVLSELQECEDLRKHLLSMNRQDLGMLISMSSPPEVVVRVMEASCYIMGMELDEAGTPKNWPECRKWLQSQGNDIFDIVKNFDSTLLTNEQIVAAAGLLAGCTFQEASRASRAAGLFFSFATGMLYDVKVRMHNTAGDHVESIDISQITDISDGEKKDVRTWNPEDNALGVVMMEGGEKDNAINETKDAKPVDV